MESVLEMLAELNHIQQLREAQLDLLQQYLAREQVLIELLEKELYKQKLLSKIGGKK